MNVLEILCLMTDEQARKTAQAIRAVCADNIEGARAELETMTGEELETTIAFLEAVLAERGGEQHG